MTTQATHLRILHLEDNDHDAELVRRTLADDGIQVEVTRVMKRETFIDALEKMHLSAWREARASEKDDARAPLGSARS